MAGNFCPQCGASNEFGATECRFCGNKLSVQQASQQPQRVYVTGINPS